MKAFFLVVFLVTLTATAGATSPCPHKFSKRLSPQSQCRVSVLRSDSHLLTKRYEGLRVNDLQPDSSTYRFHQASPRGSHLLRIYDKFGSLSYKDWFRAAESYFGSHGLSLEVRRIKRAARGAYGSLHPLSAAEVLLVNEHLFAHTNQYREFRAVVLVRGAQVKILQAISMNPNGAAPNFDRAGLEAELIKDLQAGWKFMADLHNHPFVENHEFGNSGLLMPSSVDLRVLSDVKSRFGASQAWITNGYQSTRIPL